jgi:toxin ParE1/3/4
MKVIVHDSAEDDLDCIFERIAKDNRAAATKIVARIRDHINLLELDSLAKMGRPGLVAGTRELIEYPYIIVYKVDSDRREVSVLQIVHGAKDREDQRR